MAVVLRVALPLVCGVALVAGVGVSPACAARAELPRGAWSAGLHGGYALVSMEDLNNALGRLPAGYPDLSHAWEAAVDLRYGLPDQLFVGLEAGYLRGRVEGAVPGELDVVVRGVPVQIVVGRALAMPSETVVRLVGGAGVLLAGTLDAGGTTYSGAGFLATLGGELEYRFAPRWGLAVQALARTARVPKPGELQYDLDFTGGTFRAGVRGTFGGERR